MTTKATFEHSVDVLVKAYMNDTLKHNDCAACAVGNLVADSLGCKIVEHPYQREALHWVREQKNFQPAWQHVFITSLGRQKKYPERFRGIVRKQIETTGYTWEQLAMIEKAFESVKGWDRDERMFNGLMKVVDVLASIHKVDSKQKESAKLMFVK